MRSLSLILAVAAAAATVAGGLWLFPHLFADRITAPLLFADSDLMGLPRESLADVVAARTPLLTAQAVMIELRGLQASATLADLGVTVDLPATAASLVLHPHRWSLRPERVRPVFTIDEMKLASHVEAAFASAVELPRNASLRIRSTTLIQTLPGQPGEAVAAPAFEEALRAYLEAPSGRPIALEVTSRPARVANDEVASAADFAKQLLQAGLKLTFEDREFALTPRELIPMIEFVEHVDPQDSGNSILGLQLNPDRVKKRLALLAQEVDQAPVNAKFEITTEGEAEPRVTQFAAPQRGFTLHIDDSAAQIAHTIRGKGATAPLAVEVVEPAIAESADLHSLGIDTLLAAGESNFAGSPRNRIHNITVGTSRYQGLLIAPDEEFSFNQHLGPVSAAAGFKPELVIKKNVTIPEYGGGLCQVSTTAFRAAVYSGLEVTQRKNHSYAVRYYGIPGFDATIYPGYTDLRFRNNTPGHILVQTKIEGTKLTFEFWGTADGRTVEVGGPDPYARQASGAVKATLSQKVVRDGETIIDETFHSNYRSPALFPHPATGA